MKFEIDEECWDWHWHDMCAEGEIYPHRLVKLKELLEIKNLSEFVIIYAKHKIIKRIFTFQEINRIYKLNQL
jgi:hypothetical protein